MNVVGVDPSTGALIGIDVAIVHSAISNGARLVARATRDGAAAAAAEDGKRRRYPHQRAAYVCPYLLETGGRPRADAEILIRTLAQGANDHGKAERIAALWARCFTVLQTASAEMLLSAATAAETLG